MKQINELPSFSIAQFKEQIEVNGYVQDDFLFLQSQNDMPNIFEQPTRINAYAIILCIKSDITVQINMNEYKVSPNMLLINMPNHIVQVREVPNTELETYLAAVSSDFLQEIRIDLQNTPSLFLYIKENPLLYLSPKEKDDLLVYFKLLNKESQTEKRVGKRDIIKCLVGALLHKICDIIYLKLDHDQANKSTTVSRQEAFFEQFIDLLTQYHTQQRSVTFYANHLHITPKYFSSLVKKMTGESAIDWINDFVILEAKALLKYSGKSIQEIAYKLNFPSQTFFGKYFKRLTGMSPSEYKLLQ